MAAAGETHGATGVRPQYRRMERSPQLPRTTDKLLASSVSIRHRAVLGRFDSVTKFLAAISHKMRAHLPIFVPVTNSSVLTGIAFSAHIAWNLVCPRKDSMSHPQRSSSPPSRSFHRGHRRNSSSEFSVTWLPWSSSSRPLRRRRAPHPQLTRLRPALAHHPSPRAPTQSLRAFHHPNSSTRYLRAPHAFLSHAGFPRSHRRMVTLFMAQTSPILGIGVSSHSSKPLPSQTPLSFARLHALLGKLASCRRRLSHRHRSTTLVHVQSRPVPACHAVHRPSARRRLRIAAFLLPRPPRSGVHFTQKSRRLPLITGSPHSSRAAVFSAILWNWGQSH